MMLVTLAFAFFIVQSTFASDGIYSAPVIQEPFDPLAEAGTAFAPTVESYRNLSPWAPVAVDYELRGMADGSGAFVEVKSNRQVVVGVLRFSEPISIADAFVEFEYQVPEGVDAKEIHLNMRVQGAPKSSVMRLPAIAGEWTYERIPLSDIIGGDRWRFGGDSRRLLREKAEGDPLATSIEVGLILNSGSNATLQFRQFNVKREPSPWGPLVLPRLIDIPRTGVIRTIQPAENITKAWLQIVASSAVEVSVNGQLLGTVELNNIDKQKWPNIKIPVAREFALDPHLFSDRLNTVLIRPVAGTGATAVPILCVLGYETQDVEGGATRHILVSDSNWSVASAPSVRLPDRSYKGNEPMGWGPIVDIYPLRNPDAWTTPETATYEAVPLSTAQLAGIQSVADSSRVAVDAFPRGGASVSWGTAPPASSAENSSSRWKLITPEGEPYHFLGTQVVGVFPRENYRYYRTVLSRYPDEKSFLDDVLVQIKEMGFNGIAPAITPITAFKQGSDFGLTHFQFLSAAPGTPIRNAEGKTYRMPDPFNDDWRQAQRTRVRDRVNSQGWAADPALIGVFVDNELHLDGAVNGSSLIGYFYSPDCREAFVQWLAERYDHSIEKLRAAWSPELPVAASLESFAQVPDINPSGLLGKMEDLLEEEGHATPRGAFKGRGVVLGDLYDFAVFTVETYANFVLETFRTELPGKLIASNRFMGNATDDMLAAWRNYDLIAWNAYPFGKWQSGIYTERQLDDIRRAHNITGKPVIISEVGLLATDASLPTAGAAQLYTQKQRGEEYKKLLNQVHNELPFVVGFVLFCWQNLSDTEGEPWGIVDDNGNPYRDYAEQVRAANWQLMESLSLEDAQ